MPSGWVFILFCVLLRMTEGVGSAMFFTSAFALLPELFPKHVATVMVRVYSGLVTEALTASSVITCTHICSDETAGGESLGMWLYILCVQPCQEIYVERMQWMCCEKTQRCEAFFSVLYQ